MNDFFKDVLQGLNAHPKYLNSKYFYDAAGDAIFREIMDCPEYYLTRCELEVFELQSAVIAEVITANLGAFDIVELGPGDASKSVHLLRALQQTNADFTYYPVDISQHVIHDLQMRLPMELEGLRVYGHAGDYFDGIRQLPERNRVVLFLGSNIGNFPLGETSSFFKKLSDSLRYNDMLLVGFDLKKDPEIILQAYNDSAGITRRFNLNLLHRINQELGADFDVSQFTHRPVYNEVTGACESYLVSLKAQEVKFANGGIVRFEADEKIFMEVSQKYTLEQINGFVSPDLFMSVADFFDTKHWFVDKLWQYKGGK